METTNYPIAAHLNDDLGMKHFTNNPMLCIGDVTISTANTPSTRREEDVMHGREAMDECIRNLNIMECTWIYGQTAPIARARFAIHERILLAARFIARAFGQARCITGRDEALENDIITAWVRHGGS